MKSACPMIARSDWGIGSLQQKGLGHTRSLCQSAVGFHGPRTAGWLVFMNGAHRGEDIRIPVGESKIGSSWGCDIVITGVGIGSQHASIKLGLDEGIIAPSSVARDLRLDNNRIDSQRALVDGALVTFGDLHAIFRFAVALPAGQSIGPYKRPESIPIQASPKIMTKGWLVVTKGSLSGQDFRLINGLTRIGSNADLEISISDPNLVGVGFSLDCSGNGCVLKNVHEGRAIKINGSVCEVGKIIKDSDVIAFDHLEFMLKWF